MALRACINCGEAYEGSSPYCSQTCREEAKRDTRRSNNGSAAPKDTSTTSIADEEDEDDKSSPFREARLKWKRTFRHLRSNG